MPHLKNISIIQAILMVIWSINDFETPFLLTQGGPSSATENLILLSYRYTFGRNDVGLGTAVALFTLVLLMVLATIMMRQQKGGFEIVNAPDHHQDSLNDGNVFEVWHRNVPEQLPVVRSVDPGLLIKALIDHLQLREQA